MQIVYGATNGSRQPPNSGGMSYKEWRARCPYGKWTCGDGREVIFDRSYVPILERRPGEQARPARPGEWVNHVEEEFFFEGRHPADERCTDKLTIVNAVLVEWGLASLPPPPLPAEVIPFPQKITPTPYRPLKSIPPRVNPWEYPFGAMPEPELEYEDPKPETEAKPEVEEPRKPPPLLAHDVASMIWARLPSKKPDLYWVDCPVCESPTCGVVVKDPTPELKAQGVVKYIDVQCEEWCEVKGFCAFEIVDPDAPASLLMTSAQFANFTPPDYMIDGLVQRRFLYALTGPTGSGKTAIALRIALHVSKGWKLGDRDVEKGKVLFFAGENPDDVRMRWIKLCEEANVDPFNENVIWRAGSLKLSDAELRKRITTEAEEHGPFALIIVDTSAAFFEGDDENSNTQLGNHARTIRSYIDAIEGGPAIVVTCHPVKNPDMDNLLPRGGGAFLAEIDGNFVAIKRSDSMVVEVHWHGKFRGADFAPIPFQLRAGTSEKLKDSKGRLISTVTATPITEQEQMTAEDDARRDQDELMRVMREDTGLSIADIAEALGWRYRDGKPARSKVQRVLTALKRDGLMEKKRGIWMLTKRGRQAVQEPDGAEPPAKRRRAAVQTEFDLDRK